MNATMTRTELVDMLNERGGCTPVGILTRTQPRVRKTGNPNPVVFRITRRNGFVGGSYENIVNNKREREGGERDFEAEPLPWGQHAGRFFVEHKGKYYLKFYPQAAGCRGEDRWVTPDGVEVDLSVVQPFLPKPRKGGSGAEWRTIALSSIEEITLDGETVTLKD
jgi:hypothetical protein